MAEQYKSLKRAKTKAKNITEDLNISKINVAIIIKSMTNRQNEQNGCLLNSSSRFVAKRHSEK